MGFNSCSAFKLKLSSNSLRANKIILPSALASGLVPTKRICVVCTFSVLLELLLNDGISLLDSLSERIFKEG